MSANKYYWTFVFPHEIVLRSANQSLSVRLQKGDEATQIREANTAGNRFSNVFKNYDTVVKPLIDGKYTSKRQLEIALRIIIKDLKKMYYNCFSTTYDYYGHIRSIIRKIGGVGVDVIKHIVSPDGQETTKKWESLESFFEIITFWNNPNPSYIPVPNVQMIINANKLTQAEYAEIELLDKPSQLSRDNLDQICASMTPAMPPPAMPPPPMPPPLMPPPTMPPPAMPPPAMPPPAMPPPAMPPRAMPPPAMPPPTMPPPAMYSALPIGWKQMMSSDGRIYFEDTGTGQTQWRPPSNSGGKRTRKYKCKNRNRSKHRVGLSKRSNI
jgi:hypothetical protein